MCLTRVYRGKEKKEALAKLPDEFWGWRICDKITRPDGYQKEPGYYPLYQNNARRFRAGINKAKRKRIPLDFRKGWYYSGFHFFLLREDLNRWHGEPLGSGRRMRCRIKKEWIGDIGQQGSWLCIAVKQAIFPKYCK